MKSKKKLAAKVLKTSPKRIRFADDAHEEISKAITRSDIRGLIAVKKVTKSGRNSQSRSGARAIKVQKRKGRQKGKGSKKGSKHSILSRKRSWILRVRTQRVFLRMLKESGLLSATNYRSLYRKSKGGFFRNKRHIKLYATEHNLIEKKKLDK